MILKSHKISISTHNISAGLIDYLDYSSLFKAIQGFGRIIQGFGRFQQITFLLTVGNLLNFSKNLISLGVLKPRHFIGLLFSFS